MFIEHRHHLTSQLFNYLGLLCFNPSVADQFIFFSQVVGLFCVYPSSRAHMYLPKIYLQLIIRGQLSQLYKSFCRCHYVHPSASLSPYVCDTLSTHYSDIHVTTKYQVAVSCLHYPAEPYSCCYGCTLAIVKVLT